MQRTALVLPWPLPVPQPGGPRAASPARCAPRERPCPRGPPPAVAPRSPAWPPESAPGPWRRTARRGPGPGRAVGVSPARGRPERVPGRRPGSRPTRQLSQAAQECESGVPAAPRVELANQIEEASRGGFEMRRQLGDLIAQPIQVRGRILSGNHHWRVDLHGTSPPAERLYTPISEPRRSVKDERLGDEQSFWGQSAPARRRRARATSWAGSAEPSTCSQCTR